MLDHLPILASLDICVSAKNYNNNKNKSSVCFTDEWIYSMNLKHRRTKTKDKRQTQIPTVLGQLRRLHGNKQKNEPNKVIYMNKWTLSLLFVFQGLVTEFFFLVNPFNRYFNSYSFIEITLLPKVTNKYIASRSTPGITASI